MLRLRVSPGLVRLALVLLSVSCSDPLDPLDPDVLAQIARTRADAQGDEFSGRYTGTMEPLDCTCRHEGAPEGALILAVSVCEVLATAEEFSVSDQLEVRVVQADGTIRIEMLPNVTEFASDTGLIPTLYGPLHRDGKASAAGVLQADQLIARGNVRGRFDGTIARDRAALRLSGQYEQQASVQLFGPPAEPGLDRGPTASAGFELDCRERIALDLRYRGPVPNPDPQLEQ